jgi:hypothetical protein
MRYNLRKLFVGVTMLSLLLGAVIWNSRWQRRVIRGSELANEQTIRLTINTEDKYVYGITIRVKGELDGTATLILPWDDTLLSVGPGKISQYVSHDFYEAKADLKYLPGTTKSGLLIIEYDFW